MPAGPNSIGFHRIVLNSATRYKYLNLPGLRGNSKTWARCQKLTKYDKLGFQEQIIQEMARKQEILGICPGIEKIQSRLEIQPEAQI